MSTAATAIAQPTAAPNPTQHPRLRRLSKVAGALYLAIFVIYPLSTLVRSSLVVPGDAAATADNIRAQETLFRWGLAGEATIVLVEVALAGVLYALLRPVSRSVSLAGALARVAEAVVMAAGCLATGVFTMVALGDSGSLAAFDADQRNALALFFQEANEHIVLVWGFFFALSLLLTGWLVHRSGFLPRFTGILLALAGVGYLVQSFGTFLAPDLADTWQLVVLVLAVPGELIFALWLLTRGVDHVNWSAAADRARQSQL
ncbi:DUF4386 domain-containing protein [Nocardioides donggukensis]|uniref:DUF4386 domain-containing protein n=1 Tax=Nocardioides donggukensis TaxID=2774019 RepID=A0A927Q2Q0_9ACTN|nr:DUF4386 domain-containing protein [Nocardioides donggukensis]MBD8870599.1 DUF4386 domain-containing protein [Nocardioides donggukensis]